MLDTYLGDVCMFMRGSIYQVLSVYLVLHMGSILKVSIQLPG